MPYVLPPRSTATSSRADRALTTDAPTPWRPPVAAYDAPPNLPPAWSLGEDDLDAGQARAGLDVDGDASAVVADLDGPVAAEDDLDVGAHAGQGLVDRVVDDLPEAVHEAALVGRADVHAGALAHGLEALEDLEVAGGVVAVAGGSGS